MPAVPTGAAGYRQRSSPLFASSATSYGSVPRLDWRPQPHDDIARDVDGAARATEGQHDPRLETAPPISRAVAASSAWKLASSPSTNAMPPSTATAADGAVAGPRQASRPVAIVTATRVLPIGAIKTARHGGRGRDKGIATGGAGGTERPLQFPATTSTAKRPPRFDEFPPMIVVPASTVGAQSRKPGLTVNFSTGAVRSGAMADVV